MNPRADAWEERNGAGWSEEVGLHGSLTDAGEDLD